jgi:hypothetical protein
MKSNFLLGTVYNKNIFLMLNQFIIHCAVLGVFIVNETFGESCMSKQNSFLHHNFSTICKKNANSFFNLRMGHYWSKFEKIDFNKILNKMNCSQKKTKKYLNFFLRS